MTISRFATALTDVHNACDSLESLSGARITTDQKDRLIAQLARLLDVIQKLGLSPEPHLSIHHEQIADDRSNEPYNPEDYRE